MIDFTLVYRGPLPSATQTDKRRSEKHAVRLALSPQLRSLWRTQPPLSGFWDYLAGFPRARKSELKNGQLIPDRRIAPDPLGLDEGPHQYMELRGARYRPVMTRLNGLRCHLDIKFLRPGEAGAIVRHDGDLDNRLKVLFDALRLPHSESEIDPAPPTPPDVYCLLEDDALITKFSIEAQTLLEPDDEDASRPQTYVELHLAVHLIATK